MSMSKILEVFNSNSGRSLSDFTIISGAGNLPKTITGMKGGLSSVMLDKNGE
jgi:hypothetical protein